MNTFLSAQHLRETPLAHLKNPPTGLYYRGDAKLLRGPAIAIVGTRRPSPYGLRAASLFAKRLSAMGLTVVSGLARGIDSAAHRAALRECGRTVAVLGNGIDRIYPPENGPLWKAISEEGGCIVSEYEDGMPPLKHHFPERNRIIAGLSLGTLVIEAADRSGSLITARLAAEEGREVFALPSHFDEPGFRGGHRLIQFGAKLVTTPEEILEELPLWNYRLQPMVPTSNEGPLRELFRLHQEVATYSELWTDWKGAPQALLTELETELSRGRVVELAHHYYGWVG